MYKTINKLFITLAIVLSLITQTLILVANAVEDTTDIKLTLKVLGKPIPTRTLEDGTPVFSVFSGESLNLRADFEASGTDVDIPYGSIKIWLPKKEEKQYIKNVRFVDSVNATSTVKSGDSDPKEFSVTYNFDSIRGGDVGAYPFNFKFENLITPNETLQPVHLAVFDQEGNIAYNAKVNLLLEAISGSRYSGNKSGGGSRYMGDYPRGQKPTHTPEELNATRVVFNNNFTHLPPEGARGGARRISY